MDELERRLRGRKSEDDKNLRVRLKNASTEIEFANNQGKYEFRVINDDLKRAISEVVKIVRGEIRKT